MSILLWHKEFTDVPARAALYISGNGYVVKFRRNGSGKPFKRFRGKEKGPVVGRADWYIRSGKMARDCEAR